MVKHSSRRLDLLFGALADPTRRALLRRLTGGAQTVSGLAEPFRMSLAAVSKHLRVLETARLIGRRVQGREHHVWLNPQELGGALEWLRFYERFWNERLDLMQRQLEE